MVVSEVACTFILSLSGLLLIVAQLTLLFMALKFMKVEKHKYCKLVTHFPEGSNILNAVPDKNDYVVVHFLN